MQKEDGTIFFISIESIIKGVTEVVELDAKNVHSVATLDHNGVTTYFIDSNGNMTDVKDYIK